SAAGSRWSVPQSWQTEGARYKGRHQLRRAIPKALQSGPNRQLGVMGQNASFNGDPGNRGRNETKANWTPVITVGAPSLGSRVSRCGARFAIGPDGRTPRR